MNKSFKLTLEDLPKFKEPITSPKMQKNLRILDLRIGGDGYLYSPKAFDPEWNWQTKAIWLRTCGMRPIRIAKRVGQKLDTVKKMFRRLKALTPFYRGVSDNDWATIGNTWTGDYGNKPVRRINFGGVFDQNKLVGDEISDMRGTVDFDNPESNIINNRFTHKKPPEYTSFNLKEHNKHHQPTTDPVKALEHTIISFDAYEEQERQLEAFEKRREVKHNKGKHTPRSKHPQEKVAAGHGLTSKGNHTGKKYGIDVRVYKPVPDWMHYTRGKN